MLDKTMLLGALNNDAQAFQNAIKQSTEVGQLLGKSELIAQFINSLESGKFDFVSKEDGQDKSVKEIDNQIENINESCQEVKAKTIEDYLEEIQDKVESLYENVESVNR